MAIVNGDFQGENTSLVVQLFGSPEVLVSETMKGGEDSEEQAIVEEDNKAKQDQSTDKRVELERDVELTSILGIAEQEELELAEELIKDGELDWSVSEAGELNSNELAKVAKFLSENYESIIRLTIFYSIIFFSLILLLSIVVNIKVQFPWLIGKTLILIMFLGLLFFLNKPILLKLIPHNLFIA